MGSQMMMMMVMMLCSLSHAAVLHRHHPRGATGPLHNPATNQRVWELARAAQQQDEDHETRLIPTERYMANKTNQFICCLHGHILDFYLRNVLQTEEKLPHLSMVTVDLERISRELREQGCRVSDHEHSKRFKEQFLKLDKKKGQIKAIGEIDILFDYLVRFC